jgi:small subunit ribosomal protein S1
MANHDEDEDFEALLNEHLPRAEPKNEGELLDATVVRVLREDVLVTYGSKNEVSIPIEEFRDGKGNLMVKPGDSIRVLVVQIDEDGEPELSYQKARNVEASRMLSQAFEHHVPVRGRITRALNAGVIVDVGVQAFMPASQVDLFRVGDLNSLVGQEVEAYILEYDVRQGRAVLSRRKLLTERQEGQKQQFFSKIKPGDRIKVKVKQALDFGLFVEAEGVEGLIPRSELTYDRGVTPQEVAKPGDILEVKVLDLTPETGKITFSRKRANEDPWEKIEEVYPPGSTVTGKVAAIQSFGAFVQLQEGVTGLIHAKELSWKSGRNSPEEHLKIGDSVTCQVIELDKGNKRLGLSLRSLSRDPWLDLETRYPVGSRHNATVEQFRDFGAFVKLDENTDALLHVADIDWKKRPKHPSEVLKEGQSVEVVILNLDREKRRISVGMKQLARSPFEQFLQSHPPGSIAQGKITRLERFGAFVELAPGLEGLIHISELDDQRVDSPERVVRVGEELNVKVLDANAEKQRISLSRKEAIRQQEQENMKQYLSGQEKKSKSGGFGAALQQALQKAKK